MPHNIKEQIIALEWFIFLSDKRPKKPETTQREQYQWDQRQKKKQSILSRKYDKQKERKKYLNCRCDNGL